MTATKYGELAASILKIAAEQSEECAQLALERPLQCCAQWTPLDLIVRAQCDKVGCGGKADWHLLTGSLHILLIYFNSHPQNITTECRFEWLSRSDLHSQRFASVYPSCTAPRGSLLLTLAAMNGMAGDRGVFGPVHLRRAGPLLRWQGWRVQQSSELCLGEGCSLVWRRRQ